MKNLKIKLGLFSLLAILATSVFLTSCEQETPIDSFQEIALNESLLGKQLTPPNGYKDEVAVQYIINATDSEIQKMIENYRITNFLFLEGKFAEVASNLAFGEHISDFDLNEYLTIQQLESLMNYIPSKISERGCLYGCYRGLEFESCCSGVIHPLYGQQCSFSWIGRC